MPDSIVDISHAFFDEVVRPILEREFPDEMAQMALGVFGYGSEVLRLDDGYSRDHHWGLRINGLLPTPVFNARAETLMATLMRQLPSEFHEHSLRTGYSQWKGLELTDLDSYLQRTLGLTHAPQTYPEWLSIPEEDILHIVGGEVWYDPSGKFTAIRAALDQYYPEPVRLRRLAHWCRYYSGLGAYALKRALLRHDELYSIIAFARAIRLGTQIAFLLDRVYFPYDKWLFTYLQRLPRMGARLEPIVAEAVRLDTPWERKLTLLDELSDVLDATMVEDGLLQPHPTFRRSATSGYRLLEYAYAALIKQSPPEIKGQVPVWDQIHWESFHSRYVDGLDLNTWRELLNLTPVERPHEL